MNELGFPILSLMLAVPMVAAIACLFVSANAARWIALLEQPQSLAHLLDIGGADVGQKVKPKYLSR